MKLKLLLTFAAVSCSLVFSATSFAARDLSQKIDSQSPFSSLEKYKRITRNTYINKKNTNAIKFGLKNQQISVVGLYVTKEGELGHWSSTQCKLSENTLTCRYIGAHTPGEITFTWKDKGTLVSNHTPASDSKSHKTVWLKASYYTEVSTKLK